MTKNFKDGDMAMGGFVTENTNAQGQKPFQRKTIIVKKNLQYRYMMLISLSVIVAFIIVGLDMIWTISKVVNEHPMMQPMLEEIFSMAPMFLIKVLMYLLMVIIVSAVISHKMAGPIYKFEKSCQTIADGDITHRVYLRKGDQLTDLQNSFNEMMDRIHRCFKESEELKRQVQLNSQLTARAQDYSNKIKEIMPCFKI